MERHVRTRTVLVDGQAVALVDIAKATRKTVTDLKAELGRLGVFIGVDWMDREAISATEAHGIVTGYLHEQHEAEQAWHRYITDAEEWVRRRDEAVTVASGIASRNATMASESKTGAAQAGLEAGREAGRRYEAANPAPMWVDGSTPFPNAQPRYTGDAGILRRALDKLSGVA